MVEGWKGTEAQLFAEFVEHRETIMVLRPWWRPGYEIRFEFWEEDQKQGPENFMVKIIKRDKRGNQKFEVNGVGITLNDAAKQAASDAAFRD
jgi:hypothetical protein